MHYYSRYGKETSTLSRPSTSLLRLLQGTKYFFFLVLFIFRRSSLSKVRFNYNPHCCYSNSRAHRVNFVLIFFYIIEKVGRVVPVDLVVYSTRGFANNQTVCNRLMVYIFINYIYGNIYMYCIDFSKNLIFHTKSITNGSYGGYAIDLFCFIAVRLVLFSNRSKIILLYV